MIPLVYRHMASEVEVALESARIVNLVGPRQVGKTTLVKNLLARGHFISLDDDLTLEGIENDAFGMITSVLEEIQGYPVIIDEAQRARTLPLALKRIVDDNPQMGQFLLTGSSDIFRTPHVADSLAGRVHTVELQPLTAAEIFEAPVCKLIEWAFEPSPIASDIRIQDFSRDQVVDLIQRGGFPEIRRLSTDSRSRRYTRLLGQIIDRDVRTVFGIRKPDSFRRLINQMAARTANEVNVSSLSEHLNISRPTTEQYLEVLERLNFLVKLEAWATGEHHKDVKNPKYHFVDSGLLCSIRRLSESAFGLGANPSLFGSVFESYVVNELLRTLPFLDWNMKAFHWRVSNYREIDMIVERDGSLVGIEIKASTYVRSKVIDHLRWFATEGPGRNRQFTGLIIYLGNKIVPLGDKIFAVPVSALWS